MRTRKLKAHEKKILIRATKERPESFASMLGGGFALAGIATLGIFFLLFLIYIAALLAGLFVREQVPKYIPLALVAFILIWTSIAFYYALRQWRDESKSRQAFYSSSNLAEMDLKLNTVNIEIHSVVASKEIDYEEHCWDGGWLIKTAAGLVLFVNRETPETRPRSHLTIEWTPNRQITSVEWKGDELESEEKLPPLPQPSSLESFVPLNLNWNDIKLAYSVKKESA